MAKVELKQPVVDEIKAMLDGAVGAVVVDYRVRSSGSTSGRTYSISCI